MGDYITINEAVANASKAAQCTFTQVPGKKIMFHGRLSDGKTIIMCTPQAKRQPGGFCWTDITKVQYDLLNSYDHAIVVFRLEGNRLIMWDWKGLKYRLTEDCMTYNKNEGYHWKLYIYDDKVKIIGNKKEVELVYQPDIYNKHFNKAKNSFSIY